LKKSLAGKKFASNEEVVAATEAYFADLEKTYFSDGLKKLEHRWVKCIELKGDYVEKYIATFPKFSFFFWRLSFYRTTLVSFYGHFFIAIKITKNSFLADFILIHIAPAQAPG